MVELNFFTFFLFPLSKFEFPVNEKVRIFPNLENSCKTDFNALNWLLKIYSLMYGTILAAYTSTSQRERWFVPRKRMYTHLPVRIGWHVIVTVSSELTVPWNCSQIWKSPVLKLEWLFATPPTPTSKSASRLAEKKLNVPNW